MSPDAWKETEKEAVEEEKEKQKKERELEKRRNNQEKERETRAEPEGEMKSSFEQKTTVNTSTKNVLPPHQLRVNTCP